MHSKDGWTADTSQLGTASAQSLKRIETHWLPEFRRIGVKAPILLIASKTDLSHQSMEEIKAVRALSTFPTHIRYNTDTT